MKTDPDLPSDIGPYKKQETPKKGDTIPRRPIPGSRFRSHFLVALITTMFVVAALSPLIGLLAGVIVNLVVHWYQIGMGI